MDEAGGNMAHWAGLYGEADQQAASFATAAAATATAAVSSPTSGGSGGGSPARAGRSGGVEGGRVGKPARRRSRASRRAPVTLLNTDTSNFRAMVQQFTGVPAGPYGPGSAGGGGPVISFGEYGGGAVPVRPAPTSALNMSFDHLQHRPPVSLQGQLFRPQQQQHHQQQYGGGGGGGGYGGGGDMSPFLHGGFEQSSSVEDRMLLQSMHAAQMLPRPASANNSNGYNFG